MVSHTVLSHGLNKVYITGLSAGGAMAIVMLATYPEVFAGGAIIGGLPFIMPDPPCGFNETTRMSRRSLHFYKRDVDLVITDHAMPRMAGSQLINTIRQGWPTTQVILATGYAELPPGANPDLTRLGKPFSERQLQAAIQSAMDDPVKVRTFGSAV